MGDLTGKRALVTGGAGGIGRACVEGLARRGAEVVVSDLSHDACAGVAAACAGQGLRVRPRAFDVADEQAVVAAIAAEDALGGIDILVTSAAIVSVAPILEFGLDAWERILRVNLTGTFLCAREAGRGMAARGWGRIVTISSVNGQTASSGRGAYACSKGGVDMLTRLLAAELGAKGATANAVAPPPIDTPMVVQVAWRRRSRKVARSDPCRPLRKARGGCRHRRLSRVGCRRLHQRPNPERRRRLHGVRDPA